VILPPMAAMAHSVSISKFLFTGGLLSARQKAATLRASAEQKSLGEEENQIVKDVNSSRYDALTPPKNIDVAEQLSTTAEHALELAGVQYRAGETSIIELSQAQFYGLQPQIAAAFAKYDYQINRVQLDYQSGTLP
jgi:outer membrane protein TolC